MTGLIRGSTEWPSACQAMLYCQLNLEWWLWHVGMAGGFPGAGMSSSRIVTSPLFCLVRLKKEQVDKLQLSEEKRLNYLVVQLLQSAGLGGGTSSSLFGLEQSQGEQFP